MIRNSIGDNVGSLATLHGLWYAKKLNLKRIWLEGDSLNIINCLKKKTTPSWTISNMINESIQIINSFEICVISHNFREANGWLIGQRMWHAEMIKLSFGIFMTPYHGKLNLFHNDKWRSSQNSF